MWIQLRELLRIGTHDLTEGDAKLGLRIESEVPGVAREAIPRSDAGLLVLVSYPLWTGDCEYQTVVTHYVPAHLVRRRGTARRERERLVSGRKRRTHG